MNPVLVRDELSLLARPQQACLAEHRSLRATVGRRTWGLVSTCLILLLSGCQQGASDSTPGQRVNQGWVTITSPTDQATFTTPYSTVGLGGKAFVSSAWACCPAIDDVVVSWSNAATGVSGVAYGRIYSTNPIFPVLVHEWYASVSLALGDNRITVTASDPRGDKGTDTITVTYAPPPASPTGP